jgi:hypothetical protein
MAGSALWILLLVCAEAHPCCKFRKERRFMLDSACMLRMIQLAPTLGLQTLPKPQLLSDYFCTTTRARDVCAHVYTHTCVHRKSRHVFGGVLETHTYTRKICTLVHQHMFFTFKKWCMYAYIHTCMLTHINSDPLRYFNVYIKPSTLPPKAVQKAGVSAPCSMGIT